MSIQAFNATVTRFMVLPTARPNTQGAWRSAPRTVVQRAHAVNETFAPTPVSPQPAQMVASSVVARTSPIPASAADHVISEVIAELESGVSCVPAGGAPGYGVAVVALGALLLLAGCCRVVYEEPVSTTPKVTTPDVVTPDEEPLACVNRGSISHTVNINLSGGSISVTPDGVISRPQGPYVFEETSTCQCGSPYLSRAQWEAMKKGCAGQFEGHHKVDDCNGGGRSWSILVRCKNP